MKHMIIIITLMGLTMGVQAQDPISSIIREGITRVIKAMDLEVQRLQTQTVWLEDAQRVVENAMQELDLDDIKGWIQAQKDLYGNYFQELWKVKEVIGDYQRVRDLVARQGQLVRAYRQAWSLLAHDPHFTPAEITHIQAVYDGVIQESIRELDQLSKVITGFVTQMSDEDRLQIIDKTAAAMDGNYGRLVPVQ